MVDQMQKAFDFAAEANTLDAKTKLLAPHIAKLLDTAIECSRFVREYSSCSFPSTSQVSFIPVIRLNIHRAYGSPA